MFVLVTEKSPKGSQPEAISKLCQTIGSGEKNQMLLGVTGSGKTFTMANVIAKLNRPALIMAPNKVLAAQLYREMKALFPNNAVEYFISYYDYFQPEAYIPTSNKYIEKDCSINKQIDSLRHSSTVSLLTRRDVIVVASVSCIYGVGAPENYLNSAIKLSIGQKMAQDFLLDSLIAIRYEKSNKRITGTYLLHKNHLEIRPSHSEEFIYKIFFNETELEIQKIIILRIIDNVEYNVEQATIFANSHFVCGNNDMQLITKGIEEEVEQRAEYFRQHSKFVEAERIESRTMRDIFLLNSTGTCKGVENYSIYLSNQKKGEPPTTLFSYLPSDGLLFVDESHITVPQIQGMSEGNKSRKYQLIEYGFRLPSSIENRPMTFDEWDRTRPQTIFVSATPGAYEFKVCGENIARQIVRPTGLLEPICEVRPKHNQIEDICKECVKTKEKNGGALIMCLTKQTAENVSAYITNESTIRAEYMHADTKILDRIMILDKFRTREIDAIVGINLLREGVDLPECELVVVMDADKTGFLRSSTALVQMIGRAARSTTGRVILYANSLSDAMRETIKITNERRIEQQKFNANNNLRPTPIASRSYGQLLEVLSPVSLRTKASESNQEANLEDLYQKMNQLADDLNFEEAEKVLLQINVIKSRESNTGT